MITTHEGQQLFLHEEESATPYILTRDSRSLCQKSLLSGSPLATYRRNNGAFLLQLGKSLIYFLAVGSQSLGHFTSRNGFARLAHGLQYLFFHLFLDYFWGCDVSRPPVSNTLAAKLSKMLKTTPALEEQNFTLDVHFTFFRNFDFVGISRPPRFGCVNCIRIAHRNSIFHHQCREKPLFMLKR